MRGIFSVKIFGVKLTVCFSFLCVVTVCSLLYRESVVILSLLSCIAHETGHLLAMKLFRVDILEIKLSGGGFSIIADVAEKRSRQAIILLSGVAVNFLLCAAGYIWYRPIFAINLTLGIFNLLPIGYLDGAELIRLFAHSRPQRILASVISTLVLLILIAAEIYLKAPISVIVTTAFLISASAMTVRAGESHITN